MSKFPSFCKVWDGLHVSPRIAPSKRAKLCTYFAWFLHPSQLKTVPYFELPMKKVKVIYSRREARIDLCDFLLQNTTEFF